MHFKCAMCSYEFCSGCYNPFINTDGQVLNIVYLLHAVFQGYL